MAKLIKCYVHMNLCPEGIHAKQIRDADKVFEQECMCTESVPLLISQAQGKYRNMSYRCGPAVNPPSIYKVNAHCSQNSVT